MIWERTQEKLQSALPSNTYKLWIEPLKCVEVSDESICLSSPDQYFSDYIHRNFLAKIEQIIEEFAGGKRRIIFCEEKTQPVVDEQPRGQMRLPTVPLNNSRSKALHPRYTFDEYMVGDSNILAESACRAISMHDDSIGPCLYINSDTGLGKSHLTHAVAHTVFAKSPMTRLHYLTANDFANEMIQGIKGRTMDAFKQKYHQQCDLLLVEDIHTLTGKKKTQEELNAVLDSLIKSGKRVVLTANSAPRDLVGIDGEFRSRMCSGLITMIKAPDLNTRVRIVEKKALQHKLGLDAEYIDYLGQHIRGDVRQVESAIVGIRAKCRLTGGRIDFDMIREVVASVVGRNEALTVQMISELIARQFQVSMKDLQSRSRKQKLTFPRQVAMYLSRMHTKDSLAEIGKAFNRDHSTVMHSIKKVTNLTVRDTSIGAQVDLLSDKIRNL